MQGHVVVIRRRFIGQRGIGMGSSPLRIHQGFIHAASRRCRKEVIGELGQVRLQVSGIEAFQRFADATVQIHAASRGQLILERFPDEHVGELVAP